MLLNVARRLTSQTVDQMVDKIMEFEERTRIQILSPIVRGKKGEHKNILENIKKEGFIRVIVDGEMYEVTDEIKLEKNKKHDIEIVVDRIIVKEGIEGRLTDSLETALKLSDGLVIVDVIDKERILFSQKLACPDCGVAIEELSPRMFSFNSPYGACSNCNGIGYHYQIDKDLVIPNPELSINEGGIAPYNTS